MNYYSENKMSESEIKKIYDNKMQTSQPKGGDCKMVGGYDGYMMGRPDMGYRPDMCCSQMPVYECPQERVCHRYVCYEVPHVCPFM